MLWLPSFDYGSDIMFTICTVTQGLTVWNKERHYFLSTTGYPSYLMVCTPLQCK